MTTICWRPCAAAAAFAWASFANAATANPSDPDASVPGMQYESTFKGYQPAVDASTSPDTAWRAANQAVAATSGHNAMANMPIGGSVEAPGRNPVPELDPKGRPVPSKPMERPLTKAKALPEPQGSAATPVMDMPHEHHGKGQ
jgi:hypothetical protein